MLNKVILMGRLVRDPERRYTQANVPVTSFTLAIDRGRKSPNGERQTDFIDCISWGKQGDFVKEWFAKGMMAIVVGRLQSRNWEDRNGNKRVSIEVNTDEVTFGETKKSRERARGDDLVPELPPVDPDALSANDFAPLDDSDVPF
ncbi:MAG: single-stranded DNA-binding protein [Butyricicoccus pullicaecorum]|nr:single-stranded DNA-binding protein [Butyricicoccus pullicaecorum]